MANIRTWLEWHQLSRLAAVFERENIGLDVLANLTEDDIYKTGISVGDCIRVKQALADGLPTTALLSPDAPLREVTVLLSDVVNSTEIADKLDPESYSRLLNGYRQAVNSVMSEQGGLVTNFEGDGILTLFGYPMDNEDNAERAIAAGLKLIDVVAGLPQVKSIKLEARVGIATGTVLVEAVGEEPMRQLAATGLEPALADRLQSLGPPSSVVVEEKTLRLATTKLDATPLAPAMVKGIADPVKAYLVRSERDSGREPAGELTPMVARDAERAQLDRLWHNVQDGEGTTILVFGEAGLGKSRLVTEFLADVPEDKIARYYCLPRYQNSMLHPILRQLRETVAQVDTAAGNDREAIRRIPGLETADDGVVEVFESLLTQDKAKDRIDRDKLFEALSHQLTALVGKGTSIFFVEDLHWADPTTLELLERVVSLTSQIPFMLLATMRPDFVPAFSTSRSVSTIKLIPFGYRESLDLLDKVCRKRPLSAALKRRIAERSDGVPLAIETLTRAALEDVDVTILAQDAADIPETLRHILVARLDRLGPAAKLAYIASVFGRRFSARQLLAISDLGETEVLQGLQDLEQAGIVKRLREDVFQFNHVLTADAAYESMLGEVKTQLHRKVARVFDADPDAADREPELAARHYEMAGELAQAIKLWELAGERASARSANVEAANQFNTAVRLAGALPDEQERLELELRLRLELGTQLIACYGSAAPEVAENFERAQELCDQVPDDYMRWQALYGLWSFTQVNGRLRDANAIGETLLSLASRLEGHDVAIQAHRAHGLCLFAMGVFGRSREHLERAVELYDPRRHGVAETGDISDVLVLAKCNLGWLCCFQGERERALRLHEEAVLYAEQLEHQHSLAFALALSAASYQAMDDRNGVETTSQRLVRQSESNDFPYWHSWGQMLLSWARGTADTDSDFDDGLKAYDRTGARMMKPYFETLRAELEVADSRYEDALTRLKTAEELVEETATRFYEAEIPRLRAVAYSRMNQVEQARTALEQSRSLAERQGNVLLLNRIEAVRSGAHHMM